MPKETIISGFSALKGKISFSDEVLALICGFQLTTLRSPEKLADVKELAMGYRQTIKNNFPIEKWEYFGIMDKR